MRSGYDEDIGFMANMGRRVTALSRAKDLLLIVGKISEEEIVIILVLKGGGQCPP